MAGLYVEKYKFSNEPNLRVVNSEDDRNRERQVSLFVKEAALYKIKITSLCGINFKESSRNTSFNIAHDIVERTDIYDEFVKKRELPYSRITKALGVSRTFLEIWSDLITAYIIILANPNYRVIQEYLNVGLKDEILDYIRVDKSEVFMGIILKRLRKSAIILTSVGEFKKIYLEEEHRLGEEVRGKEKKSIRSYWKQISAAAVLLIILSSICIYKYFDVTSIVVINTTSTLKLEINLLGRVVYYYSPTEKGAALLNGVNIQGENIDNAIVDIIKSAKENKMLPDSVTIFITGNALDYDDLGKSKSYFSENNMDVVINNAGYELKSRGDQTANEESKDNQGQNAGTETAK